jgi:hypothetical protein
MACVLCAVQNGTELGGVFFVAGFVIFMFTQQESSSITINSKLNNLRKFGLTLRS